MEYREFPIKTKRGKIVFPDICKLETAPKIASQSDDLYSAPPLLITCKDHEREEFLGEVNSWIEETNCEYTRFKMFGVFGYKVHPLRIDREFKGVTVYFIEITDAVHMKLCMAERCNFD